MQEGDFVRETVIDVCNRSFLIISDDGDEKTVKCETPEQFMDVMEVVNDLLEPDRIKYSNLAIYEKNKEPKG
tara:strand:+ start:2542 stop:2757 length:216 start_codon:yes stop_codon:yes gene_type:complete